MHTNTWLLSGNKSQVLRNNNLLLLNNNLLLSESCYIIVAEVLAVGGQLVVNQRGQHLPELQEESLAGLVAVGHVIKAVLSIDIAHETLLLAAMRAGNLTGLVASESFTLKLISIIFVHHRVIFSDFCGGFPSVVGATIYIGSSDRPTKIFPRSEGQSGLVGGMNIAVDL